MQARIGTLTSVSILAALIAAFATAGVARATTTVVTSSADSGPGSLRAAIAAAASGDTIDLNSNVVLTSAPLAIVGETLTITGPAGGSTINGGGVVGIMTVDAASNVTLNNLTLTNGDGSPLGGGGAVFNSGILAVNNCTFSHDTDAAIINYIGATLTVINCTFTDNASTGTGGAIFNFGNTACSVNNSTFSGNTALAGGAIYDFVSNLSVANSTFALNQASDGGAIFNFELSSDPVTITNSTFFGNSALTEGGGILNAQDNMNITFSTFLGNSSGSDGGGIWTLNTSGGGATSLRSNIIATGVSGADCSATGDPIVDDGYNLADDSSCGFSSGTSKVITALKLDNEPKDNGGPTETIALLTGSPAIGAIPRAQCVDQEMPPKAVTTDQRGFPRPGLTDTNTPRNACDIGAFELNPPNINAGIAKVQVVLTGNAATNQVNLNTTFINNGLGLTDCDGANALHDGISIEVAAGTCEGGLIGGFFTSLFPFNVSTIAHQSFGTYFVGGGPTISARLVALATPPGTCGQWTLTFESVGLGVSGIAPGTPLALVIQDANNDASCYDLPPQDAIIGSLIPKPTPVIRRAVRR